MRGCVDSVAAFITVNEQSNPNYSFHSSIASFASGKSYHIYLSISPIFLYPVFSCRHVFIRLLVMSFLVLDKHTLYTWFCARYLNVHEQLLNLITTVSFILVCHTMFWDNFFIPFYFKLKLTRYVSTFFVYSET